MAGSPSRETLAQALATWDRATVAERVAEAQSLREAFVKAFPIGSWETMELERYALGQPNSDETACWWLEFKTRPVGSMSGGSSAKHIIYYGSPAITVVREGCAIARRGAGGVGVVARMARRVGAPTATNPGATRACYDLIEPCP